MNDHCHPRRRWPCRRVWAAGLAALALVCSMSGCGPGPEVFGNALFSWSDAVLEGEERDSLFENMAACALTVLYQHVPAGADAETVRSFLRAAAKQQIAVYLLTGEPDWGLDPSGAGMTAEVARCAAYNRGLPAESRFRGVLMDAEPYLTEEWERDPSRAMAAYVSGMKVAREAAQKASLQYVACIPWFYDTKGLEQGLGELIDAGCDALAIMNYHKREEAGQIETEVGMAQAAGVPVTVIYELQAPGSHDLTHNNTYYQDGLGAVADSFRTLKERFGDLCYALHDETALREVLDRE